MATPHPPQHLRLIWSGDLGTQTEAPEEFSFGLSAGAGSLGPWAELTVEQLNTMAALIGPRCGALAPLTAPSVRFKRFQVVTMNDDGKVKRTASGQYQQGEAAVAVTGGGTERGTPFQVAMAVSLRSAFDGATGRGRFYLPVPNTTVQPADGLIPVASQTAFRDGLVGFLNEVNADLEASVPGLHLVVASGGSLLKGLSPTNHQVTAVGVGRVLDTMRSRRRSLTEAPVWVNLT